MALLQQAQACLGLLGTNAHFIAFEFNLDDDATYCEYPIDVIDGSGVQRGIVGKQKDVEIVERVIAEHLAADLGPP